MTAQAMRVEGAQLPVARPIRELRDWGTAPINYKLQISEGEKLLLHKWGHPIVETEAAIKDVATLLDLKAVYTNGPDKIDEYLAFETDFSQPTRDRLKAIALANAPRGYTAQQLAELWEVVWKTKKLLDLRQIDAIDRPAPEVLEALHRATDAKGQKRRRANRRTQPKAGTEAKRVRAELENRRLIAITAAIDATTGSSVTSVHAKLGERLKQGPFTDVKSENLPRVIRELVKRNAHAFRTASKPWPDRPDLRPQLWIFRK